MDQLTIIALYPAQNEITKALCEAIAFSECETVNIHLGTKGTDHKSVTLTLSGSWSHLTRFKSRFSLIEKQYSITAFIKETKSAHYPLHALPYQAYIIAPSDPKILDHIMQFFLGLPIHLHEFFVSTYEAPVTKSAMFDINLTFVAPIEKSISDYRESILQFCDENNFEIVLEAKRA